MFWIGAGNSIEKTEIFLLWLRRAYTKPAVSRLGVHKKLEGGRVGTNEVVQTIWNHNQHLKLGEGGNGGAWSNGICLPK